jgi:hypothetical protein
MKIGRMHTKDKLAVALRKVALSSHSPAHARALIEMADKAVTGYYHDFLSPLDFPEMQLVADLRSIDTPEALALIRRVINGEFDASKKESDEWARSPEGQEAFNKLFPPEQIGRLAMRVEGDYWAAYYALPNTMENSVLLGKIALRFIADMERKAEFMAMMREAVSDLIEEQTGKRPIWPDLEGQPAPESERSGSA